MKTTFYFLFALLLPLNSSCLLAQENEKPVVVSPLLGDTLSLQERNYYNLLPTVNNFQWAVFFLTPDSNLTIKLCYLKNGNPVDTTIHNYQSYKSLKLQLDSVVNPQSIDPSENQEYLGDYINVLYSNDKEIKGSLLSATSSSLIMYSSGCNEEAININCTTLIRPNEVKKLSVTSDINIGKILYPLITATLTWIIYKNNMKSTGMEDMYTNLFAAGAIIGIGGLAGVIISYVIPLKISSEEEYSLPLNEDEIEGLSKIARYKDFEPYYNQFIQNGAK